MTLHRFYMPPDKRELREDLWINDAALLRQWYKVLRLREGQEVVLFDGIRHDRLYRISQAGLDGYHLAHVTDMARHVPEPHVYLLWSLLNKKDKNELVVQKCTELGVRTFVPIISGRTEGKGLDAERSRKIAIEASEQCGRSDIPTIHEPLSFQQALAVYAPKMELFITEVPEQNGAKNTESSIGTDIGLLIGPEGGWTPEESQAAEAAGTSKLLLSQQVLRAETASIAAVTSIMLSTQD